MKCDEVHIKNINFHQSNIRSQQYKTLISFISKDAIKYYDILETTNSHCSHLVLFRSLEEQGEARQNAICLAKLLISSSVTVIVTDTCRLQLNVTADVVKFAFHQWQRVGNYSDSSHTPWLLKISNLKSKPFHQETNCRVKILSISSWVVLQ